MGWVILGGVILLLIGIASIFCGNPLHWLDTTDNESDYGGSGGDYSGDGGAAEMIK